MNENHKYLFFKNDFIPFLSQLKPDQKGVWGVMNAQQMVEHFSEAVKIANGKLILPVLNEGDKLQKFREFLMSEEPFKENTKNPLMPERAKPCTKQNMQDALLELKEEIDYFFMVFKDQPLLTTNNSFFGALNFDQNLQLLYKHAKHHLKQFGIQ